MTEKKDILRTAEWVLALLLLVLPVITFHWGRATAMPGEGETARDTTVRIVTKYKDFPDPVKTAKVGYIAVPKYLFLTDSVDRPVPYAVHDTTTQHVYLPREQKYFEEEDGRLRLWVSGYDPRLDRWELDRLETTITETIYAAPKRWGLDLFAGAGGTFSSQPLLGAQAGLELRYEPGRWGLGIIGGYSVNMINGKLVPAPFIGGRAKFNIISW